MSTTTSFPPVRSVSRPGSPPTNFFAAPDVESSIAWPAEFSAWLDKTDRVVHLSEMWDDFAPEGRRRREVLARPVGWFIAEETVRECFRTLFARIRREHRPARIIARCDQRERPRAMRLSFVPLSAGAIEITWSFISGALARQTANVPCYTFEEGELLRVCGWCQDVHLNSGWERLERAAQSLGLLDHRALPPITHGMCPACKGALAAESAMASRSLTVAV